MASITVEQHLLLDRDLAIQRIRQQTQNSINALKQEFHLLKNEIFPFSQPSINQVTETSFDVVIVVKNGFYKGNEFNLHLRPKNPKCLIGRSRGKNFRLPYGLSLTKDQEVSTTHLEITLKEDGVWINDLNSTNGSVLDGESLIPHTPILCPNQFSLIIGMEELQVQVRRV